MIFILLKFIIIVNFQLFILCYCIFKCLCTIFLVFLSYFWCFYKLYVIKNFIKIFSMCYMVLINKLNIVSQFMWIISCCIVSYSLFVRWYALVLPLLRFFNFLLSSGCSFRIKFFYILCIWIICKMINFTWKFLNWRVWNLRTIVYAANCLRVTLSDVASIWYCLVIKLSS